MCTGLTVKEWSGLLCHSTGQHAVGQCQGGAGRLSAPVFVLYLPEGGAPAVGVWLKHIILLIVHAGALEDGQPSERREIERRVVTTV